MENSYKPWGKSLSLDLFECDKQILTDPEKIKQFVSEIITVINMKAHGPCYIERFGSGLLEGYSAMQFIETSSITIHCDEVDMRAFIDIFSCKDFDEQKAIAFSEQFFSSHSSKKTVLTR